MVIPLLANQDLTPMLPYEKNFVPVSADMRYNVPVVNIESNRWPDTALD